MEISAMPINTSCWTLSAPNGLFLPPIQTGNMILSQQIVAKLLSTPTVHPIPKLWSDYTNWLTKLTITSKSSIFWIQKNPPTESPVSSQVGGGGACASRPCSWYASNLSPWEPLASRRKPPTPWPWELAPRKAPIERSTVPFRSNCNCAACCAACFRTAATKSGVALESPTTVPVALVDNDDAFKFSNAESAGKSLGEGGTCVGGDWNCFAEPPSFWSCKWVKIYRKPHSNFLSINYYWLNME